MSLKQKFSTKNVIVLLWRILHAQVANLNTARYVQMCPTIYSLSLWKKNWKTLNDPIEVVRRLSIFREHFICPRGYPKYKRITSLEERVTNLKNNTSEILKYER